MATQIHKIIIACSAVLALIILYTLAPWFTVNQNQMAAVSTFGRLQYTAEPGLHFRWPIVTSVTYYRTDLQSMSPDTRVNTYTIDNQEVDVIFTVFYHIPPAQVSFIYTSNRDYSQRLFSLTVDRMKAAMGQVNVQSVAEKRGELRDRVKAIVQQDAKSLGIEVTDFQLTDLQYTEAFRQAVNNAAVQKANIEAVEYQRQQAVHVAETAKVRALGEANAVREQAAGAADARVLNATAEARAIQIQGEAQGLAIKAQADALVANPRLVDLRKAERWDGKLPQMMLQNMVPFMNVDQATLATR